jgi:hypothetical protein
VRELGPMSWNKVSILVLVVESQVRERGAVPNVIVYRLHHAALGLADGHFQPLCLALAGHGGRGLADGTVRIHPDDAFPRLGIIVSGIHGLAFVLNKPGRVLVHVGKENTTKCIST